MWWVVGVVEGCGEEPPSKTMSKLSGTTAAVPKFLGFQSSLAAGETIDAGRVAIGLVDEG